MDTSGGLETVASGLNLDDEVVYEEVELKDNVEHTTGSSGWHVRTSFQLRRGLAHPSTPALARMMQERGAPMCLEDPLFHTHRGVKRICFVKRCNQQMQDIAKKEHGGRQLTTEAG